MIEFLQKKSLSEGLRRCCSQSKNNESNRWRCSRDKRADGTGISGDDRVCVTRNSCIVIGHHLVHNHNHDPLIYAHLCVDSESKELIRALRAMKDDSEKVAAYLAREKGI
jgi:hypothetical protein